MSDDATSGARFQCLKAAAKRASANAWSPHSGFQVGAAVSTPGGEPVAACNVESDSYGLTQCAERNAIAAAIAAGTRPGEIDALLIYVPGETPLPPCGGCRQWMVELLSPGATITSCCDGDQALGWSRDDLLPGAFRIR